MRLLTAPYLPEVFEDAATLRSAEDLKCHTPTCALCHGGTATSLLPMPGCSTGLATSMHTGHWDASGYSFCTKLSARPRPRARRRQSEPGARRLAARLRVQPEHTVSRSVQRKDGRTLTGPARSLVWLGSPSPRRRPVASSAPGSISARRTVHMHACLPASGPHAWMPEPGPFRRGCSPPLRRPGPAGRLARSGLSRFVPLLGRRGRVRR